MNTIRGSFIERVNRFVVKARVGQETTRAHLPNPGRLWELLIPETPIYLIPKNNKSPEGKRLNYRVFACKKDENLVLLDTHYSNHLFKKLLLEKKLPFLEEVKDIKSEVKFLDSRIDFFLRKNHGKELLLEVKTCTLFGKKLSMFPDAPSKRATKHLLHLAKAVSKGLEPWVIFLVMNYDVDYFLPAYHIDLEFSETLFKLRKLLKVKAIALEIKENFEVEKVKELKIPFEILEKEMKDRGAYFLVVQLDEPVKLRNWNLSSGYYVYVGSGMKGLHTRINRHLRRRKKLKWHIDYLLVHAKKVVPIPVVASERLECEMAKAVSEICDLAVKDFGCSDCNCDSHLFFFERNPISNKKFQDILTYFRMDRLCSYLS